MAGVNMRIDAKLCEIMGWYKHGSLIMQAQETAKQVADLHAELVASQERECWMRQPNKRRRA